MGGEIWRGPNGLGGEWGHNPIHMDPSPLEDCYCGRRHCIENYVSGPALARYAMTVGLGTAPLSELLRLPTGLPVRARFLDGLAQGLAQVINILDPEVVVLGGGLSNVPDIAADLRPRLLSWVFSDGLCSAIVLNTLGDSAGVLGAAALAHSSRQNTLQS